MVTYDTLITTTQTEVYNIIKNATSIVNKKCKIMDGLPFSSMQSNVGFPYIQVQTPTFTSKRKTFSTTVVSIEIPIVCYSTTALNCRELVDDVRKAITDNRATTTLAKLDENRIPSSSWNQSLLDNGKTILYTGTVNCTYDFWGEINV